MRWRVKLDHAPKSRLDYHFLRSSLNPDEVQALHNPGGTAVITPKNTKFAPALAVELTVREDGTASPRFIYREGASNGESSTDGTPFFLDMTYGSTRTGPGAYIGFDFGTSNSALCFVDPKSIEVFRKRAAEASWSELGDLVGSLPYPLAVPIENYLGCADPRRLVDKAREFTEAALAMAAYSALLEYCSLKGSSNSKLFKGFTQRSAGPLWALLKDSLQRLGSRASISAPYVDLLRGDFIRIIDSFITFLSQHKHQKASDSDHDHLQPVKILANVSHTVFSKNLFGYFEEVHKRRFAKGYEGRFRHACGPSRFIELYSYEGDEAFSEDQAFLIDADRSVALPLQPFIFWHSCARHSDDTGHCYLFDTIHKEVASFKAVGHACVLEIGEKNSGFGELSETLAAFASDDQGIEVLKIAHIEQLCRG